VPRPPRPEFGKLLAHGRALRGYSQLKLAERAGVSARHISFLEIGRAQPSREMVVALARALEVPPQQRNAWLRAAGFAELYAASALDAKALEPALRALKFVLARHEPLPALVIDAGWDVQLSNRAARRLFSSFVLTPPAPSLNVLRLLFDPAGLRPFVVNWAEIAGVLIDRLHREALGAAETAPVRNLLAALLATPGLPAEFAAPELSAQTLPFVPLILERDGLRLSLFSLISSFGTPLDLTLHDLRIETLLPADEATRLALESAAAADRDVAATTRPK
jgi:transcriptional regulator with XRE-family HTH domain